MLPDIPFAVARAAVIKVCRSSPFFSSVAEVVEAARELDPCQEHLPTAAEAWEEVSRLIQDVGPYRAPQYSCDTVKRAARSIGWRINLKTQNSLERIFHYQDRAVRTLMMGGEPWFVAKDVCAALGIVNSRAALDGLEEDEIASVGIADTSSSSRRTITVQIVSEPGLYSLVLKSRRPEAREFRRWITHEVIPVLRRTGGYQLGDDISTTGKLLPFSLRDLLQLAAGVESECEALRQENAALRPKAEFYERVADTSACFSLGETAKMLEVPGFGRNNLIRFLRSEGILMTNNVAKQKFINRGYFRIVQTDFFAADGTLRVKAVTRVYEKGVDYIRHLLVRL